MPKYSTFPTLYDNVLTISTSFLKTHKYLESEAIKRGTLTWSRNGREIANISIQVNNQSTPHYLELDYQYNKIPINYRVLLVSIPSNLGKGIVWFFICPHTGKRCRKLYLVAGHFFHRSAFRGCMYEKQTQSKNYRRMENEMKGLFQTDHLYEQLYKKNFKKRYAGKPTKKYLRLTEQIIKAEGIADIK